MPRELGEIDMPNLVNYGTIEVGQGVQAAEGLGYRLKDCKRGDVVVVETRRRQRRMGPLEVCDVGPNPNNVTVKQRGQTIGLGANTRVVRIDRATP